MKVEVMDPMRPALTHTNGPRHAVWVVRDPADQPLLGRAAPLAAGDLTIRPTPKTTGRTGLVRDIHTALGKNPFDPTEGSGWQLCHAWITAQGTTALIVDRAHLLATERLHDLGALAKALRLPLWLIWSTDHSTRHITERLGPAWPAARAVFTTPTRFLAEAMQRKARTWPDHEAEQPWPRMPLSECWTFLRECRLTLSADDFDHVRTEYRQVHAQAHRCVLENRTSLVAWLRDAVLGTTVDGHRALVRLRAVQTALLQRNVMLHWDSQALGADPAASLPSRLTPQVSTALVRRARTDQCAIAVLALHLEQSPQFFELLSCDSVRRDGSVVRAGPRRPPNQRPTGIGAGPLRSAATHYKGVGYEEFVGAPIVLPAHARPFIAAQRAFRLASGARPKDPLFVHPDYPDQRCPEVALRSSLMALAEDLNIDLPWLHRSPCPQRLTVTADRTSSGWLATRGLCLQPLGATAVV